MQVSGGLVEGVQQGLLGGGDGLSIEGGDFGSGAGLLDGALGLGGEEGTIALGMGIALGDSGGDTRGATGGRLGGRGSGCTAGLRGATAAAMRGQAFGNLSAKGRGGGRAGHGRRIGGGEGELGSFGVKQCGAHFAQTLTHFREID